MAQALLAPISVKVRPDEKDLFQQTCEDLGTSPSNAIRMFVVAFNKRGGFPFDPSNPYAPLGMHEPASSSLQTTE